MSHYSDPTAARALGGINREFSRLEKKAEAICARWAAGELSDRDLEKAHAQFTGIYRHVLTHALKELQEKDPSPDGEGSDITQADPA